MASCWAVAKQLSLSL